MNPGIVNVLIASNHERVWRKQNPAYETRKVRFFLSRCVAYSDPQWEPYFEEWLDAKMANHWRGCQNLLSLWQSQRGLCPICHQKVTKQTGWHSHHIVWQTHGGMDGISNRVLLHPTCHRQVHSRGLHVEKPRPPTGV